MAKDNWKEKLQQQLRLREELIERIKSERSDLKFNRPYLIVSDIASQFYSEAKLELEYIFGRIRTREQKQGKKLHELMAKQATEINYEDLFKEIEKTEEITILETSFFMKYQDSIIAGKPDVIIFRRGIPILVLEYKFSKYTRVFQNQKVQAQLYGKMLEEIGFNTDLLYYGIIIAPRKLSKVSQDVRNIPRKLLKSLELSDLIQKNSLTLNFGAINVFLYKFNSEKTFKNLDWAIQYWKGKRKPKPLDLLNECESHGYKEECKLILTVLIDLLEKFSDNIISIYGIGSFFDKKLPKNWIKNDIDMVCIVKNMEEIPKTHDWTKIRKLDYKKNGLTINVFFNSLEGLQEKEKYKKQSWANYKWSLLDFKVPQNSIILYGDSIHDKLPELNSIPYDYEDLLQHAFYHLDHSFEEDVEKAMKIFTKAVFKFGFIICVYFDDSFKFNSIINITEKIKKLVEDKKVDDYILNVVISCIKYRQNIRPLENLSSLRENFIKYCFHLLIEDKLWKNYSWDDIISFCKKTYNGLSVLENLAKRERNIYYFKKSNSRQEHREIKS